MRIHSVFLPSLILLLMYVAASAQPKFSVSTIAGNGTSGYSDTQVNNPYGVVIGPDGALYFCDLDNQRIRRLDLKTKLMTTVAGNGRRAYTGDGGPATEASLNMPHELRFDKSGNLYIVERDNHTVRKIDRKTNSNLCLLASAPEEHYPVAHFAGYELLVRPTLGFARKASLHPRLYAPSCSAG